MRDSGEKWGGREGGRERGREGGREGEREGGREGEKEMRYGRWKGPILALRASRSTLKSE